MAMGRGSVCHHDNGEGEDHEDHENDDVEGDNDDKNVEG